MIFRPNGLLGGVNLPHWCCANWGSNLAVRPAKRRGTDGLLSLKTPRSALAAWWRSTASIWRSNRGDPGPDRPQRRRQEHDLQPYYRHLPPYRGGHQLQGQKHRRPAALYHRRRRNRPDLPEYPPVWRADRAGQCPDRCPYPRQLESDRCPDAVPACRAQGRRATAGLATDASPRSNWPIRPSNWPATCPMASSAAWKLPGPWPSNRH